MTTTLPESQTISLAEAAAMLGISRSSCHRMAEAGDLPTVTLGVRRWRVHKARFLTQFGLSMQHPIESEKQ